ncbi:MAG: 50S ribosomal protein L25 [Flavobacteriales bacterium]|nr:50S ribosomal protein L25 [Flavobacteriales bacterium]
MKTIELKGSLRKEVNSKGAKELRRNGQIPCVLVQPGGENVHFSIQELELRKIIYTSNVYRVTLDLDGSKYDAVATDYQFHPVTDKALHVDFLALADDRKVQVNLPVVLKGNSIGVRNGGKLALSMRKVGVIGLPKDFPDAIEIDITKLRIGHAVRIGDLSFAGLEYTVDPRNVVVMVKTARGAVDEDEEEEEEAEGAAEGGEAKAEAPAEAAAE